MRAIRSPILLIVVVWTLLAFGPSALAIDVNVDEFGAIANDAKDDGPAIRAALTVCTTQPSSTLHFSKGRYNVERDSKGGESASSCLYVHRMQGLTIDGGGAEIVGHGETHLFDVRWCKDLSFRNLSIDYDTLPFSSGTVVATGDNRFDVRIDAPQIPEPGRTVEGILGYDLQRKRLAVRGLDYGQQGFATLTESPAPGIERVFVNGAKGIPVKGTSVILRRKLPRFDAFHVVLCEGVTIQNVTVRTAPGMGFYAGECRDVSLSRFDVMPPPGSGRKMSTRSDATHFTNCRGTITVEDCHFEAAGDDGINVCGEWMAVADRPGTKTIRLKSARDSQAAPPPVEPGDVLEFSLPDRPMVPFVKAAIVSATMDAGTRQLTAEFADALPEKVIAGCIVADASACPALRARRVTVTRSRARGVLVQTRDAVVEDCTFDQTSGAGVQVTADTRRFFEGPAPADVTIRRCAFLDVNYGSGRRSAALDVFGDVGERLADVGSMRGLTIEDNTIRGADGAGIGIASADGVVVRRNLIERCVGGPPVLVRASRDVSITANRWPGVARGVITAPDAAPVENKIEIKWNSFQ